MESYSQNGEDRLVWNFFGHARQGTFVEIGAHHPQFLSQTCLLEQNGWTGVLIEPIPRLANLLRQARPGSRVFQVGVTAPESCGVAYLDIPDHSEADTRILLERPATGNCPEVSLRTIDQVLADSPLKDRAIDFLSIDIEGMEISALRGLSFERYQPRLILIEDHVHDLSKHRFLKGKGYRLVHRTGSNNWYVPKGRVFACPGKRSRLALFRKLYLGLPFRKLALLLRSPKA